MKYIAIIPLAIAFIFGTGWLWSGYICRLQAKKKLGNMPTSNVRRGDLTSRTFSGATDRMASRLKVCPRGVDHSPI